MLHTKNGIHRIVDSSSSAVLMQTNRFFIASFSRPLSAVVRCTTSNEWALAYTLHMCTTINMWHIFHSIRWLWMGWKKNTDNCLLQIAGLFGPTCLNLCTCCIHAVISLQSQPRCYGIQTFLRGRNFILDYSMEFLLLYRILCLFHGP